MPSDLTLFVFVKLVLISRCCCDAGASAQVGVSKANEQKAWWSACFKAITQASTGW